MNRGKRGGGRRRKKLSMEAGLGVLSRKTGACGGSFHRGPVLQHIHVKRYFVIMCTWTNSSGIDYSVFVKTHQYTHPHVTLGDSALIFGLFCSRV